MTHAPPNGAAEMISSVGLADLEASGVGVMVGSGEELTPVEVAREFKVSPATVRRWEERGLLAKARRLPGSKHRRYSRESVDALKRKLSEEGDATTT